MQRFGIPATAMDMNGEDEAVDAMNARLSSIIDHALGCGFLEGHVKQRLIKLPPKRKTRFCPDVDAKGTFTSVEDTSTAKGALQARAIVKLAGVGGGDLGVRSELAAGNQSTQETKMVMYSYKRVIAKRSIPMPHFNKLLPVRKKTHLDKEGRWLVELFGNQLCTAEQYGGRVSIQFTWSSNADISTSKFISKIQAGIASGIFQAELVKTLENSQMRCGVDVKGFALPASVARNLTTVADVMDLILSLNKLPIECAVAVDTLMAPVSNVVEFPYLIKVETQIRDQAMLDKVEDVLLRLQNTGHRCTPAFTLAEDLMAKIEDASLDDRALLPELGGIVASVVQMLADHGKCVHLYKRYGEYRLRKDNCSKKPITSAGTQVAAVMTAGLSIPVTQLCQKSRFDQAETWTVPEHYKTHTLWCTHNESDYYHRVKFELLFNNDALVSKWRAQIDNLCVKPQAIRPRGVRRVWDRIVGFCRCWR